jgi:hypothetical protein
LTAFQCPNPVGVYLKIGDMGLLQLKNILETKRTAIIANKPTRLFICRDDMMWIPSFELQIIYYIFIVLSTWVWA